MVESIGEAMRRSAVQVLMPLLVVGIAAGLSVAPAAAQGQAAPKPAAPAQAAPKSAAPSQLVVKGDDSPNAQPWTLDCSNRAGSESLACVMSQVLFVKSTSQRAIGVTIFRPDPKGSAMMRISLPHGILLPDGVSMWVDSGQPTSHVIAIADQNGSYSTFELDGTLILMLKAGHVLNLGVKLPNGQSIDFQLSLKGFSTAFDKV